MLQVSLDHDGFERHPFISIHPAVEKMVSTFVKDARAIDPKFEIFICGEHGGDVYTIGRLHEIGLSGVSMSPRLGLSFDHQGRSVPGAESA